jgi:hypothetical protein
MSLKEKFQITVPGKDTGNEPWASFKSARNVHGEQTLNNTTATQEVGGKFNTLPPGMDIGDQMRSDQHAMEYFLDGQNDVTKDDPDFLKKGFSRGKMKGTDDQYTGEHIDLFYGDAGGFIERNNYLDRE